MQQHSSHCQCFFPGDVYEVTDKPQPIVYRDLSTMREVRDRAPYQYDNQAMVATHFWSENRK